LQLQLSASIAGAFQEAYQEPVRRRGLRPAVLRTGHIPQRAVKV